MKTQLILIRLYIMLNLVAFIRLKYRILLIYGWVAFSFFIDHLIIYFDPLR